MIKEKDWRLLRVSLQGKVKNMAFIKTVAGRVVAFDGDYNWDEMILNTDQISFIRNDGQRWVIKMGDQFIMIKDKDEIQKIFDAVGVSL